MDDSLIYEPQNVLRRRDNAEKWEKLKTFFYDGKRKIYGRKDEEWIMVVIAYSAFYVALILFFIVLLGFALLCMDDIKPFRTGKGTPLQDNPGLAMRPVPDHQSTLIRFVQGKPQTYKPFTDHIQTVLLQYENEAQVGENFIGCKDGRPPNSLEKVCRFEINDLGPACTWQKDYGYDEGQPCVLFKLNKIFAWEAEPYGSDEIPGHLDHFYDERYITLTCEGEYAADHENIGNITISPPGGFRSDFFPFLGQEGFRSPLAMVQFNNPVNGVVINVICKAWARNIWHHRNDQQGLVRFQLLVD